MDEIQRVPDLFSYLQERVDLDDQSVATYVLTGSQQFLLMEKITQSLAGNGFGLEENRVAIQTVSDIRNMEPKGLVGDYHYIRTLDINIDQGKNRYTDP